MHPDSLVLSKLSKWFILIFKINGEGHKRYIQTNKILTFVDIYFVNLHMNI